jgi:predicted N-acetyltransferase YhbS
MIELAHVVRQLRAELAEAQRQADGEELRLELGPIELELSLVLSSEGGAGGKVRFWVVEVGADGRASGSSTLRVTLTLNPRFSTSAEKPYVSGETELGER